MTEKTTLIICPSPRAVEALAFAYHYTPSVTVKGPSVTGHRADTVVVMPMPDEASDRERELWEKATREHFSCRVRPGGELIVL